MNRHRRGTDLGAALLRAPFVDLVSTALNPEAPLVAHEASEWGDATNDAAAFDAVNATTLRPATSCLYRRCCAVLTFDAHSHQGSGHVPVGSALCRRSAVLCPQMAALCPYYGIAQRAAPPQPPVLVTCAADDSRVPPWGPAKWVAALSAARQREPEEAGEAPSAARGGDPSKQDGLPVAQQQRQRQQNGSPGSGDAAAAAAAAPPVGSPAPALLLPRPGGGHFGDEREHFAERALEYAFVVAACEP